MNNPFLELREASTSPDAGLSLATIGVSLGLLRRRPRRGRPRMIEGPIRTMRASPAFLAAALSVLALSPAPLLAQEASTWSSSMRWADGSRLEWSAAEAPGCFGSGVQLRFFNGSASSGLSQLRKPTFTCRSGGEFVSPDRNFGVVTAGGTASAAPLSCVCAEKGGVLDLKDYELQFTREGPGEEINANGCVYRGSFSAGRRNGKGVYSCPTGQKLEGVFRNGSLQGRGTETLPSGQTYTGDFEAGVRHGQGRLVYVDRSVYEGDFRQGLREGTGSLRYPDGAEYVGEWKADRRVGRGTYVAGDRSWTYDGEWAADLRSGLGKLKYADGSYSYEGPFRNDLRDGEGEAEFSDGRSFKGRYAAGEQIGSGVMTFPDGRTVTGEFRNHQPEGRAVDRGATATFDGVWKNGVLNGPATVTSSDGRRYEGAFVAGLREGAGVEWFPDGSRLECRYVADRAQKPCNKVLPNGRRIEYRGR